MKKSLSITVITKLITPNAGNQAISSELIRLLASTYPDARIYAGWQERGLDQYSFARLQHAGPDPLRTLDSWVERILKKYDSDRKVGSLGTEETLPILPTFELSRSSGNLTRVVKLDPLIPPLSLRIYNKGLRTLKQLFDCWRVYGKSYKNWLNVLKCSDLVMYSPAGAVMDDCADDRVRDLLGLRIAQRLGAKVVAVNQSIEIKQPFLLRLLGQLYSGFDAIVVRDPVSAQCLTEMQVPRERIKLAPDTAYLAQLTPVEEYRTNEIAEDEKIKPGTVGITVQPKKGLDFLGWGKIIERLRTRGKEVLFVSHQMCTDRLVGIELQKRYGVKVLSRQYDYGEYIRVLSLLELIISERYHTCVFSAIANRPFVPLIVHRMRKMLGIVSLLNYPLPAVDITSAGWQDTVMEHVDYIYGHYDRLEASLHEAMPRLRKLAEQNVRYDSLSTV